MSNTNGSPLIDAVGYLRRSTDKQEASIQDQRTAVQKYADEHGYVILRWYIDDAISGDDTSRRHGFLRMLADAQERRDFKAILCWDGARFGRFDSIEAGYYIHPLRKAGVYLATVMEGVTDWNDSTGRIVGNVKQEGKHQQLLDLSANVTRGQLEAAKNGSWIGSPPYAYRIEGERKQKRLVMGDPSKVRIVKRIFHEFVEEDRSMMNIAERLNAEGIPSPGGRGKPWRSDTVKVILENPAYVGDYAGCRYSYGKYHTIRQGTVSKANGRSRRPESEWIVRRDHHEPIIDRTTFEQAQALFARGKTGRSNHYTEDEHPYHLVGLLRCGRCGCPLWGMENRTYRYYECSHRKYSGKTACEGTTVREDTVLNEIAGFLEGWLGLNDEWIGTAAYYGELKPEDLPEAFDEIRKLLAPSETPKRDLDRLRRQADSLQTNLEKARANLVLLDATNIPAAQERIRELADELASARQQLEETEPPAEKDLNTITLRVLQSLYSLAYCCRALARSADPEWEVVGSLEAAAPKAVRRLLHRAGHVVCHTEVKGEGTGRRHVFKGGEIVIEPVGVVAGNLNPHVAG